MNNRDQPDFAATSGFVFEIRENTVYIYNHLTLNSVESFVKKILQKFQKAKGSEVIMDLNGLKSIDSAGITSIYYLQEKLKRSEVKLSVEGGSDFIRHQFEIFRSNGTSQTNEPEKIPVLAKIGDTVHLFFTDYLVSFITLTANVTYWSITDIFKKKTHRRGEFYNQAVLIGVNSVYIVAILSFIIGLVLALQSAAQLRNFGANIYIVDLTVIAMMREMGPLITAILVAGRSGSSIAAEIATMKVTSELDALKTMAMNPIRFVIVPKMHGSIVTFPFLTILADVMGILGGMLIANYYLGISPTVFINRMGESLYNRDILIGIFKSFVFAGVIVMTGSFFGLQVKEGAEGVGKVTTLAVVVAISLVIIADSILGIIFY